MEIEHLDTGARRTVDCDTVVFTGDWIPDHELARTGGARHRPGTPSGPWSTPRCAPAGPGCSPIGNLLHPVDTADVAALDGRHVARHVLAHLHGRPRPAGGIRLLAEPPLRWISPAILPAGRRCAPARAAAGLDRHPGALPHRRRCARTGVVQARRRLPWAASPGRVFRIPAGVVAAVDPAGGTVTVSLR